MRPLTAILLVLLTSSLASTANGQETFVELRNAMATASNLPEQRRIVARMHELLRQGAVPPAQVGTMIYGLARKPVFAEDATITLLLELIETPGTAEAATTAIAYQFRTGSLGDSAGKAFADALRIYHRQQGLSDAAITNLQSALSRDAPPQNRAYALQILQERPQQGDGRDRFLNSVANLLDPDVTAGEKLVAIGVLATAAASGELPQDANRSLYRVATRERNAAVRVAAWPIVMQPRVAQKVSDREPYFSLGRELTRQLNAPPRGSIPSFIEADEPVREQAVELLNEFWHPDYPSLYVDALITLVEKHGSAASANKLVDIRRANGLTGQQLAALAGVSSDRPHVEQAIEAIIVPSLAPGSLVGPLAVIQSSDDPAERAAATKLLFEQHPEGPVPVAIAEAAYAVMAGSNDFDAAAVSLVVRGDEPFAAREEKILRLVDRTPRKPGVIVQALQQLHGDVGIDFLVRRYANDDSIEETFRGTLLNMLFMDVHESGRMDAETTATVTEFALTADNYFSTSIAVQLLQATGAEVPWSIRVRQKSFRWSVLSWVGIVALVAGSAAGLYVLVLVALPGRKTGLTGAARASGFVVWLILSLLFVGTAGLALLGSLGHTSTPSPDRAMPYYAAVLAVAIALVVVAIVLHRRRSSGAGVDPAAARI
ncbi:MAG: hypothetical protein KJO31_12905 [Gammaproteobacteria bacterium]|nr:hypothetical protein [Gammaproteobacteria bacterium]